MAGQHKRLPANYSGGHWQGRCSCGWSGEWLATRGMTVTAWEAHRDLKPVNASTRPPAIVIAEGVVAAKDYVAIRAQVAADGESRYTDVAPMEQERMADALIAVNTLLDTIVQRIEAHQEMIIGSEDRITPSWVDSLYEDIKKAIKAGEMP